MSINSNIAGYIAITSFLIFTGLGALAQLIKLHHRTNAWRIGELERDKVCDGLHPVREIWSFSAFLLFALSGLTRNYIDYFLLFSRLPVIVFCTIILWYLQFHKLKDAKKFYFIALSGNLFFIILIILTAYGIKIEQYFISKFIDYALGIVSVLLFYGKSLQAITMYKENRSKAVSWLRESGNVIKDLTGLNYSVTVGNDLIWISVTHILSAISSLAICIVKYLNECRAVRKI